MDVCPTGAIPQAYVVDGSRCISYLTIELKDQIPSTFKGKMDDWVFGCDLCQEVCPWNRFSRPHQEPLFAPQGWEAMDRTDWIEMTEEVFQKVFRKSAVKRTKYHGLKRSIAFTSGEKEEDSIYN